MEKAGIVDTATKLVTLVASIAAIYFSFMASQTSQKASETSQAVQVESAKLAQAIEERTKNENTANFHVLVYKEVLSNLNQSDKWRQKLALSLVKSLEPGVYQTSLLEVIRSQLGEDSEAGSEAAQIFTAIRSVDNAIDSVNKALSVQNTATGTALDAVKSLPDTPLRTTLLDQLKSNDNAASSAAAAILTEETKFKADSAPLVDGAASAHINFDVFWCATGDKARNESVAGKLKARIEQVANVGRVRSRMLPDSVNAQLGYRVKDYQIRYEDANSEKDTATEIKAIVDPVIAPGTFVLHPVANRTPSYLSLFVCT